MNKLPQAAIFGDVILAREYCPDCDGYYLVIDGELQCCNRPVDLSQRAVREVFRVCNPDGSRYLSEKEKRDIRANQGDTCFYCYREFGTYVWRAAKGVRKPIRLSCEFDHCVPFSYFLTTQQANIVAACHVCNRIKSNLIFEDGDAARQYLAEQWVANGYASTPGELELSNKHKRKAA